MENWHSEIVELHDFFEDYLKGTIPASEIGRIDSVFAESFAMVAPDGSVSDTKGVKAAISGSHGALGSMKMRISNAELVADSADLIAARYIEHQDYDGGSNSRRATVVFQVDPSAPNGLKWLTVHETWLP